jgi:tetratricopeptide (TPR) repeat protein
MPKRRAEDTPGMVMTDHWIQRRRPDRNLTAEFREGPPEQYLGEIVAYYPATADPLYLTVAQVGLQNNLRAGLPQLAREMAARRPRESEFYIILGDAYQAAGDTAKAETAYREAARLAPKSARALRASGLFEQALALDAADPITWFQYGLRDLSPDKIAKAISLDPMLPDQQRTLGEALFNAGKPDAALDALRDALRTDPSDDAAWDLTGRALAETRQWHEAFYDFERAVRLRPSHASYLYDYALALARADRLADAKTRAEEALRADPKMSRAQQLLDSLRRLGVH